MEIKDLVATQAELLEYDLIIERNSKIEPVEKRFKSGEISRNEYIDTYEWIIRVYDRKIKELYKNEPKTIMSK